MKLLHLDAGLQAQSVSRELSSTVVRAWQATQPAIEVTYRDLAAEPPPHMSGAAWRQLKFGERAPESARADLAQLEQLVSEFLAADAVVIGAPMYNFAIASTLKCWIDAICQPGRTFTYTPQGPRGLAGGKRVVIASSRGNRYAEGPLKARDFQEPYLLAVLGFVGVTQIDVVRAEGVNIGPAERATALARAHEQIAGLFPLAMEAQP
jgi:FMN-dependent NADH-azoreductase